MKINVLEFLGIGKNHDFLTLQASATLRQVVEIETSFVGNVRKTIGDCGPPWLFDVRVFVIYEHPEKI